MLKLHPFITSAQDGCEWMTSPRPGRFVPRNDTPYPLNKKLGGPQRRSGRFGGEKNSFPDGTATPHRTSCSLVAIPTELS